MEGSSVILSPSEVLHVPGLGFDGLVGYSPIAMAKNAIGLSMAAEEYGAKFYANGAAPSGVLEHPGVLKDPAKVRDSWNEAQFLETRKFQIDEIARIFRVPPHMVGALEKSSFSNIEQQSLEFVKYTLDPWVVRWEQSLYRALLSSDEKNTYFFKFNLEGLLRGDYQSRMQGYSIGIQNGFMCPNDVRELENLDLIPDELGGNKYMVNGNMVDLANVGAAYTGNQNKVEEKPPEETSTNRRKKT